MKRELNNLYPWHLLLFGLCQIFYISITRKLEINLLVVDYGRLLFRPIACQQPSFVGKSIGKMLINMVRREKTTPEKWSVGEFEPQCMCFL
jgi:hypothetical protein